jgi:hypothetical protein
MIQRGTPCHVAVNTLANRFHTSPQVVCRSLCTAGVCKCQKINGQIVCVPVNGKKCSPTIVKTCQADLWQCFVDWCICSGCCTPRQLISKCGNQNSFMKFCCQYLPKQVPGLFKLTSKSGTTMKNTKRRSTTRRVKRTTTRARSRRTSTTRFYSFPTFKTRTTTRRYRRAA